MEPAGVELHSYSFQRQRIAGLARFERKLATVRVPDSNSVPEPRGENDLDLKLLAFRRISDGATQERDERGENRNGIAEVA